jgi:hypothetical protein
MSNGATAGSIQLSWRINGSDANVWACVVGAKASTFWRDAEINQRSFSLTVSMEVSQRLFRLLKAMAADRVSTFGRVFEQGNSLLDEKLDEWEKAYGSKRRNLDREANWASAGTGPGAEERTAESHQRSEFEPQFVEDLKLFELQPPSNLEAVKKARNQELKKFHPDKYQNDPEKMAIANQIVRLYNAAYERLRRHYERS